MRSPEQYRAFYLADLAQRIAALSLKGELPKVVIIERQNLSEEDRAMVDQATKIEMEKE